MLTGKKPSLKPLKYFKHIFMRQLIDLLKHRIYRTDKYSTLIQLILLSKHKLNFNAEHRYINLSVNSLFYVTLSRNKSSSVF